MNHVAVQRKSFAANEEIRGGGGATAACRSAEMNKELVVCPKPRRLGLLHATLNEPSFVRPLRWHSSHSQEVFDAEAGNELLDIILSKGNNCGNAEQSAMPIASSPPFFCGSPPSRVSNPLIQDSQFGDEKCNPVVIPAPSGLSPSSAHKPGGCVRANFGHNPAVRVEGFDCLGRDRRNCSIPTLA